MSFRPLFLAVPTALVAAAGLAWVTTATASNGGLDSAPQVAQAAPPAATPPVAGGPEQNARPPFSPRQMCVEHVARRTGMRAYLKARLDLKPDQMQAWNTFEKASDDVSAKAKTRCATLPTEAPKDRPSFADRFSRRETMMKARLDAVETVKPSLMALYAALTPEQKEVLDRPKMHGGHHWHHHGRG